MKTTEFLFVYIKFNNSLQPKKIITMPHIILIARKTLALKRSLNNEMVIAKPVNQMQEAVATPKMKATKTNLFTHFSYSP